MSEIIVALWPLFALIICGYFIQNLRLVENEFWPNAERINYYFLFPSLLFSNLAHAPLHSDAMPRLLSAITLSITVATGVLLILKKLRAWPPSRFGVLLQGLLRFNIYLGLSAINRLFGEDSLLLASVVLAILVPVVNILSVMALSSNGATRRNKVLGSIIKNPLILACLGGVISNLSGIDIKWGAGTFLSLLADTSLPLGLLCVGAALTLSELKEEIFSIIANSAVRLCLIPLVTYFIAQILALPGPETAILVLFFSLPTAPNSYILARQMEGNSQLMAGIITFQTLFSVFTLSVVVAMLS